MMGVERRLPGAAFSLFCRGKQWLGWKKPRREATGEVRPPSRARNQAREPRRRKTRPPAQGRARRIRAQKGSRRLEARRPAAAQRSGTRRRERYAGTEPQNIDVGMGNMTKHDTMQRSSMNRAAVHPGRRPGALLSSPRPRSRGPSMAPDTAAAGGERDRLLKLPPEPRLDPGSGAGATGWARTASAKPDKSDFFTRSKAGTHPWLPMPLR